MAKIKKYKIARRLGAGVYEKTQGQKFMLAEQKRSKARTGRPKRPTDYGLSLIKKQRVRFSYGVSEKQFRTYVDKAMDAAKRGLVPSEVLFKTIESRFDNVIYRSGFASTRAFGRQLATHGHFLVNGKRLDVPSYLVKKGDVISIREGSKTKTVFADISERLASANVPGWLSVDVKAQTVTVTGEPKDPEPFFDFQSIIEFYSR
ncbi:30S ribosomal protein S4 [Patescibacteria group bacterium]|nr:30S ribosomal protein S4 [Patescibacteria group bacterium]